MNETTNYKLKQPEPNEYISIDDLNQNAEILDTTLKDLENKKADKTGGDISDTIITTLDTPATQFPTPSPGDTTKTFLGKVRKFITDFKNWQTGVCTIGQIVNNCTTNNASAPLSAAQGKVLMALVTKLNTDLEVKYCENIDALLDSGIYYTGDSTTGTFPAGFHKNGVLRSVKRLSGYYIKYTDAYGKQADRVYVSGWRDWDIKISKPASTDDFANIELFDAIGQKRVLRVYFTSSRKIEMLDSNYNAIWTI